MKFNVVGEFSRVPIGKGLALRDAIEVAKHFPNTFITPDPENEKERGDHFTIHHAGLKKIHVIKELRTALDIGLVDAKKLVEDRLPYTIWYDDVEPGTIHKLYNTLNSLGCDVKYGS